MKYAVDDRLVEWLRDRAARNFRDPNQEITAILWAARTEEQNTRKIVVERHDEEREDSCQKEEHGAKTASGFRGVYKYGKRWMARFVMDGVQCKVGVFDAPEDAARAWDTAQRNLLGNTGFYNFPLEGEQALPPPNVVAETDLHLNDFPSSGGNLDAIEAATEHYWDKGKATTTGKNNGSNGTGKPGNGVGT